MRKIGIYVKGFAVAFAVAAVLQLGQSGSESIFAAKIAEAADDAAEAVTEVTFSEGSGAYSEEFSLSLSAGDNTVYYTTDGSNPKTSSTRVEYTEPIAIRDRTGDENVLSAIDPSLFDSANVTWDRMNKKFKSKVSPPAAEDVDKATVIRAVSMDASGNYSTVQTNTYFIGSMKDHIDGIQESCEAAGMDLAIMSIAVEQKDLFDPETGIYVHGNIFDQALEEYLAENGDVWNAVDTARSLDANYKQKGKEWEREAHVDYFESNGDMTECKLQQDCGIRIQGNYSRSDLQKGLRLYAREDYGPKNFKYAFFDNSLNAEGETMDKFKKLTLRNGGNCAFTTKCSDAYWQSLIRDLKCETQASRVCVVYLNGEYWGIYILQEEFDNNYMEEKRGVEKDNVIIYKGDAEALELGYKLDEGELPEGITDESYYFQDLFAFFDSHEDLKSQEDYEAFAQLVDVESVRDYFAANVWMNNKWDWPGKNWSIWRVTQTEEGSIYGDGRWRFCFYDLDFGGVSGSSDCWANTVRNSNLLDTESENPVVKMFAYLMTNEGFRADFAERLLYLDENNFEADRALAMCDTYQAIYEPLYDQFFARFGVGSKSEAINGGYASLACIRGFVESRSNAMSNILEWVDDYYQQSETPSPSPTSTPLPSPTAPSGEGQVSPSPLPPVPTETDDPSSDDTDKKALKKIKKLNVKAVKGKKAIQIKTVKKAKITVKAQRNIIKKGKKAVKKIVLKAKKNRNGTWKISLKGKLKKADKITVTVSRSGYQTKKKVIRIK